MTCIKHRERWRENGGSGISDVKAWRINGGELVTATAATDNRFINGMATGETARSSSSINGEKITRRGKHRINQRNQRRKSVTQRQQ